MTVLVEPQTPPVETPESQPARTKRARRTMGPFAILATILAVVVLALLVYPGIRLFMALASTFSSDTLAKTFGAEWFWKMVFDTVVVVGASSVIAVVVAGILAWVNERTSARFKGSGVFPLIPLFMPSIAVAIGWIVLADSAAGFLNGVFRAMLEPLGATFALNIFSYPGLIFIYVICLVPYPYLTISAAFRSLDGSVEEAGRVSGANSWRILRTISLPAIFPSLLAGFMLALIVGMSFYSVPVVIEGRTGIDILTVRVIHAIRGVYPPDYDTAITLSVLLLVVLVVIWLLQKRIMGRGNIAMSGSRAIGQTPTRLGGGTRWFFRALLIAYGLLSTVLPLAALIIVSFMGYWQADVLNAAWSPANWQLLFSSSSRVVTGIQNSVILGLVAGGLTVIAAAILVIFARDRRSRLGSMANSASRIPAAVPHAVLAVAFIFAFASPPFNLAGTLLILGLAYFTTFLAYAAVALEPGILSIHRGLEDAAALSGANSLRTFRTITLPMAAPAMFAAWALIFVKVAGDLEVSALLATGDTPTVGLVLLDMFQNNSIGVTAAVALIMTAMSGIVIVLLLGLGRPRWQKAPRTGRSRRESSS